MDGVRKTANEEVSDQLKHLTEGVSDLVKEHVELAKVELLTSGRKVACDLALTAAGVVLLAVGYVLLMFAIGFGLADAVGDGRAFLIVSGVHLFAGLALVTIFAARMRTKDKVSLAQTSSEIQRDKAFLNRVSDIVRDEPPAMVRQ